MTDLGRPISAAEAFNPDAPLLDSALRAIEHLDAKDAEIKRLSEDVERLYSALEILQAGMNDAVDSNPRVKASEVRMARAALAATRGREGS